MDIRKLRWVLPAAQVVVGIGLYYWGWQQVEFWRKVETCDCGFRGPAWELLDGIGAPLPPLTITCSWLQQCTLTDLWQAILLVAVLWYWVGANVSAWKLQRRLAVPQRRMLRLLVDAVMVLVGGLCAGHAWPMILRVVRQPAVFFRDKPLSVFEWAMAPAGAVCGLVWAVVLIVCFGRDFGLAWRARHREISGRLVGGAEW
jgi:hypothetical protein